METLNKNYVRESLNRQIKQGEPEEIRTPALDGSGGHGPEKHMQRSSGQLSSDPRKIFD